MTNSGLSIGSGMSGGVKNLTVRDCVLNGTARGPRFKTCRGRGGIVEDIKYQNLEYIDVGVGIEVNMLWEINPIPPQNKTATPIFRNCSFENLFGRYTDLIVSLHLPF